MIFNYSRSYKVWSLILVQDGSKGNSQLLFCWGFFKIKLQKLFTIHFHFNFSFCFFCLFCGKNQKTPMLDLVYVH